jgi:hypothetical protein
MSHPLGLMLRLINGEIDCHRFYSFKYKSKERVVNSQLALLIHLRRKVLRPDSRLTKYFSRSGYTRSGSEFFVTEF